MHQKKIGEDEYNGWNEKLKECTINIKKKENLIEKCYDYIEQELVLLGATVVEDKLQKKVPETIKHLRQAGIKIWVLTGDKITTLVNIGLSCNLIFIKYLKFLLF